ncbi:hypothetical protein K1719_022198 [Acacia pycnantha]|nr:hypothetical protein K1719_022198 [Acacia pycnantha]
MTCSGCAFSASLPPYLASGATKALEILEKNPNLVTRLKNNIALLWKVHLLVNCRSIRHTRHDNYNSAGLRLEKPTGSMESDQRLLEDIAKRVTHSESDLRKAAESSMKRVAASVLSDHNSS